VTRTVPTSLKGTPWRTVIAGGILVEWRSGARTMENVATYEFTGAIDTWREHLCLDRRPDGRLEVSSRSRELLGYDLAIPSGLKAMTPMVTTTMSFR